MKESEARTKSCPLNLNELCRASDCMAWEPDLRLEEKEVGLLGDTPEGWHRTYQNNPRVRRYVEVDSGDCGMPSKPCECNQ